jgi:hypothetical protein
LNHRFWQTDSFNGKCLNHQLGYYSAAMVAAGGTVSGEIFWLVDGDIEFLAQQLGHANCENTKIRASRAAANDRNLCTIVQTEVSVHILVLAGAAKPDVFMKQL